MWEKWEFSSEECEKRESLVWRSRSKKTRALWSEESPRFLDSGPSPDRVSSLSREEQVFSSTSYTQGTSQFHLPHSSNKSSVQPPTLGEQVSSTSYTKILNDTFQDPESYFRMCPNVTFGGPKGLFRRSERSIRVTLKVSKCLHSELHRCSIQMLLEHNFWDLLLRFMSPFYVYALHLHLCHHFTSMFYI